MRCAALVAGLLLFSVALPARASLSDLEATPREVAYARRAVARAASERGVAVDVGRVKVHRLQTLVEIVDEDGPRSRVAVSCTLMTRSSSGATLRVKRVVRGLETVEPRLRRRCLRSAARAIWRGAR